MFIFGKLTHCEKFDTANESFELMLDEDILASFVCYFHKLFVHYMSFNDMNSLHFLIQNHLFHSLR